MSDFLEGIGSTIVGGANVTNQLGFGIWDRLWNAHESKRDQTNYEQQFNYIKDQNQIMREREDNAVRRRVADLEAAGINKLAAVGQAASAQGVGSAGSTSPVRHTTGMPDAAPTMAAMSQIGLLNSEKKLNESQADYWKAKAENEGGLFSHERYIEEQKNMIARAWNRIQEDLGKTSNRIEARRVADHFKLEDQKDSREWYKLSQEGRLEEAAQLILANKTEAEIKQMMFDMEVHTRDMLINNITKILQMFALKGFNPFDPHRDTPDFTQDPNFRY
jgi:hypothetical protein